MSEIFNTFIACLLINLIVGYLFIKAYYVESNIRGSYGLEGPKGIVGKIGKKGEMGEKLHLNSCEKVRKLAKNITNVMIKNNSKNSLCNRRLNEILQVNF